MISRLKKNKLVFSIGAYTVVNLVNKGIPFLLLPLLTHYLSTKDYGIITNIQSLLTLTVALVGINLSAATTRQYVKKDVNLKDYFTTSFRTVLISFALISVLYTGLADFISQLTYIPVEIIYFISFYALMDTLVEALLALLRMKDKPFFYGVLQISRTIIDISISLLLIMAFHYEWLGRFLGLYIGCVFIGLYTVIYFLRKGCLTGATKKEYRKHFLSYGLPLIPHAISGVVIMYSDKLIITDKLGIEENGIYSVAFTIGMVISLLQNSFNQAWVPWLYKKLEQNDPQEKKKLVKITYLYIVALLGLVFLLWLITPAIYYFLGKDFSGGMEFVAIIGLGFAFNGMYKMMINYVFYAEKNHIVSIITLFVAALNIVLNLIFIDKYGLIGSAYATSLTFLVQFIVTWILSSRIYPMPWFKFR